MTTYPGSPRVAKGAIVGLDPLNPLASVIVFQYNPATMTRSIQATSKSGSRAEPYKLEGPPKETITVKMAIDAADQLERDEGIAKSMGIHPQLAALEMLLYPKSAQVIANTILAAFGSIEVTPPDPLMTLFIWGAKRVLPVRIISFTITEENHDPDLNPIQAKVDVSMQVMNYNDFGITHPGYYVFLTHQVVKEVMATIGSVGNLGRL